MATYLYSLLTVILFCVSCSLLMREAARPIPLMNETAFSKKALRVAKTYKVAAWSAMSIVFFVSLVISFIEVLTQL